MDYCGVSNHTTGLGNENDGQEITVIGAKPKTIEILGHPKRRIDPADLAAALGASPSDQGLPGSSDPTTLAELGTQLLYRLRSRMNSRAPFSAEDVRRICEFRIVLG
jgi:hypothetical protein